MQVKINVGGAELVVSVSSVEEVAALVEAMKKGGGDSHEKPAKEAPKPKPVPAPLYPNHIEEAVEASPDVLRKVIDELREAEFFKYLVVLGRGDWLSDEELRAGLGMPPGGNIGPPLATLSLTCNRHGVDRKAILIKRVRSRGKNGRANYDYKITDAARTLVDAEPRKPSQGDGLPLGEE